VVALIVTIIEVVLDIVESVVTIFIGKKTDHERNDGKHETV
jgi:hypothetical protein